MPLDLKKVLTQIKNIEGKETNTLNEKRLDSTYTLFKKAFSDNINLIKKLVEANENESTNFYFATPFNLEDSINDLIECSENFTTPHIAISTDGSQINPSAHEISNTSLINIGSVAFPYFHRTIPVQLSSEPTIYNSQEEINSNFTDGKFSDEDLISYERTIKEIEETINVAKKYLEYKTPIIVLLDGTLIHWHLEKFPNSYIKHFIERMATVMSTLKELNIPIASYISSSRSNDLINMLKIYNCPFEKAECIKNCSGVNSKNLPCNPCKDYISVLDRRIIEKHFIENKAKPGTRTILFKSNSKILNYYPDDFKILFFYFNTGTEIARVEIPSYVGKDTNLLSLIHNVIALQCKVGFGYPVTISEAHNQAVIRKNDREIFYNLIKEHSMLNSKNPIRLSNKELRKRVSFV